MAEKKQLSDEDMARVEEFLESGVNDTPRKPFKPLRLMIMLIVVVMGMSFLSVGITRLAGISG